MHKLFAIALLLLAQNVQVMTGPHRKAGAVATCTPPPGMNYRWGAYAPTPAQIECGAANGNTTGGVACTNGATVDSWLDFVIGDNAANPTTANRPTFVTGATPSGKPAVRFINANSQTLGYNGINYAGATTFTAYAVFKPASATLGSIFSYISGTAGSPQFFFNGLQMELNNLNRNVIVTGTHTLSSGTWYVSIVTYDFVSGNGALYLCSAGSCINDGTGNLITGAWGNNPVAMGGSSQAGFLDGQLAEAGWINNNVTSNAAIATYVQCQYGI